MRIHLKKVTTIGKIVENGQDGAIYGSYLFAINRYGDVSVYDIESFGKTVSPEDKIDSFKLDKW